MWQDLSSWRQWHFGSKVKYTTIYIRNFLIVCQVWLARCIILVLSGWWCIYTIPWLNLLSTIHFDHSLSFKAFTAHTHSLNSHIHLNQPAANHQNALHSRYPLLRSPPLHGSRQENCDIVSNYTVVSGDTLGAIATAQGVTPDQVLFVNPSITNANFVAVGDVVAIPDSACVGPDTGDPIEPTATCSTVYTESTYTVVAGDTFTIIANEKLDITLASLIAANTQVADLNVIEVGEVLNVPLCEAETTTRKAEKTLYYDCLTTKLGAIKKFKNKSVSWWT